MQYFNFGFQNSNGKTEERMKVERSFKFSKKEILPLVIFYCISKPILGLESIFQSMITVCKPFLVWIVKYGSDFSGSESEKQNHIRI